MLRPTIPPTFLAFGPSIASTIRHLDSSPSDPTSLDCLHPPTYSPFTPTALRISDLKRALKGLRFGTRVHDSGIPLSFQPSLFYHVALETARCADSLQDLSTHDSTSTDIHYLGIRKYSYCPGFYKADEDDQLVFQTLPKLQITQPNLGCFNLGNQLSPQVSQWRARLDFSSLKRPPELMPAFSSKRQRCQNHLSSSSTSDVTSSEELPWDICEILWNMKTPSLKYHQRKIENGASCYSYFAKEGIVRELARREKGGGSH
ncbi:hypothetical protein N7453_003732 [Penicillium expansum]|nr:hypothetical protein N7453_003732 [Penicillium expansum]